MNTSEHQSLSYRALPRRALVVGLGTTGLSAVRFLMERGVQVLATDSRADPPLLSTLRRDFPSVTVHAGGFDTTLLADVELVVVSPGIATVGPFFDAVRARGLPMAGDIELFARSATAPVVGITGTNGKSTVTTLVIRFAERAGWRVRGGGNLGPPALELLDAAASLYVLELSSFQLELTESLALRAATILNITPDHLDRYADLDTYAAAKARIFRHCETAVIALDDPRVVALRPPVRATLSFAQRATSGADYYVDQHAGTEWLMCRGEPLLPVSAMRLTGTHNVLNALAALALGEAAGIPREAMLAELRTFPGLPHRTQWVADVRGVRYVDDSKGTNVGATLAAVAGLPGPLLLIVGGDGKGQDFSPLRAAFAGKVRAALLIGRDAPTIAATLVDVCPCYRCDSLEEAVRRAAELAQAGDLVLLSPACASLDMFRDYAHRGAVFAEAVGRLAA